MLPLLQAAKGHFERRGLARFGADHVGLERAAREQCGHVGGAGAGQAEQRGAARAGGRAEDARVDEAGSSGRDGALDAEGRGSADRVRVDVEAAEAAGRDGLGLHERGVRRAHGQQRVASFDQLAQGRGGSEAVFARAALGLRTAAFGAPEHSRAACSRGRAH